MTGAFLMSLALLSLNGSGCKEGNNSVPISTLVSGPDSLTQLSPELVGTFNLSGYLKCNNDAVVNFPVELLSEDIPVLSIRTTGEGRFFFQGLASGMYTLRAASGSATYTEVLYPVYILANGTLSPENPIIQLEKKAPTTEAKKGAIDAFIKNETTKETLPLADVRIDRYVSGGVNTTVDKTITDGNGYVTFPNLDPGIYILYITLSGYKDVSYPVSIQHDGSMSPKSPTIYLSQITNAQIVTGDIAGYTKFNVAREAIANVQVILNPGNKTTKTTGEGKFIFQGLTPGQYELTTSHADYENAMTQVYVLSNGTTSPVSPEIILTRKQSTVETQAVIASGTIRDAFSGSALEFVTCVIKGVGTALTDSNGRFVFPAVSPGSYEIEFSKLGYSKMSTLFKVANAATVPSTLNYYLLYNQETDKGSIVGRFVLEPGSGLTTSDLQNAVVRVYKWSYRYQLTVTGSAEYNWTLESATPEPVKSSNVATSTTQMDPYVYGTFKISHLEPTSNIDKYIIYIGKDNAKMQTDTVFTTTSTVSDGVVLTKTNAWFIPKDNADMLHSWKDVVVGADKSTYLTNFELYK